MRKTVLLFLLVFAGQTVCAQQAINLATGILTNGEATDMPTRQVQSAGTNVIVTYHIPAATIWTDPLYPQASKVAIKGFTQNFIVGQPNILFRSDAVNVPLGALVNVELLDSTYVDVPMVLGPARPPLPLDGDDFYSTGNVPEVLAFTGFCPSAAVEYIGMQDYRGAGIAHVAVRPIQYNYTTQTVRLFSHLQYRLHYVNTPASILAAQHTKVSPSDPFVSNMVLNSTEVSNGIQNAMALTGTELDATTTAGLPDNIGYLIVSTPKYREPIKRFMDWKRTLGFTVDTLMVNWQNPDTTTILNAITQYYANADNLYYLLIVGDAEDIPTFHHRINLVSKEFDVEGRFGKEIWGFVTDYDYGLLESVNDTPKLKRGRIPVKTVDEANIVFDKIIEYERNPVKDEDFYTRGLNIAQYQNTYSGKDVYETHRFTLTSEGIRNLLLAEGKTVNSFYYSTKYDSTYTLHWNNNIYSNGQIIPDSVRSIIGNSNTPSIVNRINEGTFYVFYYDHASTDNWASPYFSKTHINGLVNANKLPVVISCCCYSGLFTSNNCFAEAILKRKAGGCVGIIASTAIILTGVSDTFLEGMFSSIWPKNGISIDSMNLTVLNTIDYSNRQPVYRLGDVLDGGIAAMKEQFNGVSMYGLNDYISTPQETTNFTIYASGIFHLFGDPTMELWTDVPQKMSAPVVNITPNSIHVETTDGEARISFYTPSTGSVDSYIGTSVDYAYTGSKVKISIARHNHIPCIIEVGGDIYIQNESIQGERVYQGDNIFVGSNVTPMLDSDEVIFQSGSETAIKGNSVRLDKGTKIELGAKVNINK